MSNFDFSAPPLTQTAGLSGGLESQVDTSPGAISSTLRVLLVEDREDQQRNACDLLCRWGIKPAVASNGVRAVKLCRNQDFDVILMDIAMPIMDGLEATRLIRRDELARPEPRRCPIIAYTSGGDADDRMLWKTVGIDDVLDKPTHPDRMAACLRQWCGGGSMQSSLH